MDNWKSPRFFLALAGIVAVTILAALKVFAPELAAGLLGGILYGVGVASPATKDSIKYNGSLMLATLAGIGGSIAIG